MNETIAGIILVVVVFGGSLLLSDGVEPDLSNNGVTQYGASGHPLWSD